MCQTCALSEAQPTPDSVLPSVSFPCFAPLWSLLPTQTDKGGCWAQGASKNKKEACLSSGLNEGHAPSSTNQLAFCAFCPALFTLFTRRLCPIRHDLSPNPKSKHSSTLAPNQPPFGGHRTLAPAPARQMSPVMKAHPFSYTHTYAQRDTQNMHARDSTKYTPSFADRRYTTPTQPAKKHPHI